MHENHQLVVSIPVDHSWDDIRDLDQKARAWLHATAAQRAAASRRKSR
ncbi:hypothetical protein AB0L88_23290 [Saccharopolyspora shandongensis]